MKIHLSDLIALFFFVRTVFTEGSFVYFADRGKVKAPILLRFPKFITAWSAYEL